MYKGISIVIPVKNRVKDLIACIESIKLSFKHLTSNNKIYKHLEIVIVDDNSDVSIKDATSNYNFVRVIKNTGIGPGAARNLGLKKASYNYVGFIDSDCKAKKDWLSQIICSLDKNESTVVQGNPCLFMKENNPLLGKCEEKLYIGLFKSYIRGNYCIQIDTRNCAFNKNILKDLKGDVFITDMKKAQAEARVCGNNLVEKGIKILYDENMIIYHKDPSSIIKSIKQKSRHGSGRIYVWSKTPSFKHFITRYYWKPIFKFRVPFWYVIPTHSAFIIGYFNAKKKINVQ